jgi:hypothetical protein
MIVGAGGAAGVGAGIGVDAAPPPELHAVTALTAANAKNESRDVRRVLADENERVVKVI